MELQLWLLGIIVALIAFLFKHEREVNLNRPEIKLDTIFNCALSIRNIGNNNAKQIIEVTKLLRDVPQDLLSYSGTIKYLTDKDFQIFKQVDFCDLNKIKPESSVLVRFEYKDPEGYKFYSCIEVRRNHTSSPPWFYQPKTIKTGRILP